MIADKLLLEDGMNILVPKNSGLKNYRELVLSSIENIANAKILEARGEDIPFLVKQFIVKGKKAVGLTGEDLFKEYCLENKNTGLKIIRKIVWNDQQALFRKPVLCLVGPQNKELDQFPKNLTVCIAAKYKAIAKKYLNFLERKGYVFKKIYINGCVETSCSEGIADLVIDIVYTGNSLKRYDLKIYDKIIASDFVIIGENTDSLKKIKPKKAVQEMTPYDPPTEQRRGKLRLDFNENTRGCSPLVLQALKNSTSDEISMYPDYSEFRKTLAKYLEIDQGEVLQTNGTDEGIKVVMDTYLEKNDEVIIPQPTFALFELYARVAQAKVISVPYNQDLSFPAEQIFKKINNNTRIIVLVNPNNPTGTAINQSDLIKIIETAKNAIIFLDEAYYQYYGKTNLNLFKKYNNLIISQTFSKAFGLAGLRLGYLISNKQIIADLEKVISPYSINALALKAGTAALKDLDFVTKYVEEVKKNRVEVEKQLNQWQIKTYPSKANFIVANFGEKCNDVYEKLKQNNILVRDRSKYPLLANCLRLGIGVKEECALLLEALRDILFEDQITSRVQEKKQKRIILFDMDGVLIDVSNSYRLAIQKTVAFFTNNMVSNEEIQAFKEKGGYNNDWDLSEALILARNITAPKQDIINKFQEFYLGINGNKGFIDNEKLLINKDLLKKLSAKYKLGIVTGRPRKEAIYILNKFGINDLFKVIIGLEDYPSEKAKPDPYSIQLALTKIGNGVNSIYLGDNIDDITAAKSAGIDAIGVLPSGIFSTSLKKKLEMSGAKLILDDINQLGGVIL